MTGRGEEAASLMSKLSVGDTVSPDDALEAYRPESTSQARASVILRLSQTKEDLVKLFLTRLTGILSNADATTSDVFAVVRLMSSLYAVAPQAAHSILFDSGNIGFILAKSVSTTEQDQLFVFITAELLCAAANQPNSRRWILSEKANEERKSGKIVEIDEKLHTKVTSMHWLLSFVEKANLENATQGTLLSKTGLLCSLALHKIRRGSKGKDADGQEGIANLPKAEEDEKEEEESKKEGDDILFELSKANVLSDTKTGLDLASEFLSAVVIDSTTKEELNRVCRLSSVEGLTYLSLDSYFRDAVVDAKNLLLQLCRLAKMASGGVDDNARSLFPPRESVTSQATSTYDLDKVLSSPALVKKTNGPDAALQYGLATLLANLVAYPPLFSSEEKQMAKLKKMANAKTRAKGAEDEVEKIDERMTNEAIDARIEKVIVAGGVEALCAIVLGTSKQSKVSASRVIQDSVSNAISSMTTRQDKLQRGKIIQQGGGRALLTLSNQSIADALQGKRGQEKPTFTSMQGLAHLLITENPTVVLRDAGESIPSLVYLYLHCNSSRLQRFEAALALTNLASLGPIMATGIVSCSFPRNVVENHEFAGAGSEEVSKKRVKILDVFQERIFLEDNEMSRRSSLELLCNLLVEESTFKQWSGEEDDDLNNEEGKKVDITKDKTMKNLIFLIALCSPLGFDETCQEGGLKLRLAASGAVATLCSSPSTCERLLRVESRVLNKLSRLVNEQIMKDQEEEEEKKMEAELHQQDISEDSLGSYHASLQLALRGLTCLDCLIQYVSWLQNQGNHDVTLYKQALVDAKCVEAIQQFALSMVKAIKSTTPSPIQAIESLQKQVAQQSFDSLRACKSIGLV